MGKSQVENADAWRDPNPWQPMTDITDLKVLGKYLEEMGECLEANVTITAPREAYHLRLENEIVDVHATIVLVVKRFKLTGVDMTHVFMRTGKAWQLSANLGRAITAASRCLIQGIEECEPITKKPNREWLEETISELLDSSVALANILDFDRVRMLARLRRKLDHLESWHAQ